MDIALEPDGSVRALTAREAVEVTLPATKDTGPRTIRSTSVTATGNPQGLREMKFDDKVEYREAATKAQGARVVRVAEPRSRSGISHRCFGPGAFHRRRRFHRRTHARDER